jgi:hypothetical protein
MAIEISAEQALAIYQPHPLLSFQSPLILLWKRRINGD